MIRLWCYATLLAALTALWAFGCDRAARAQVIDRNNTSIWILYLDGKAISLGEPTEEACEELRKELDAQLPPFPNLECRMARTYRESI